MKHIHPLRLFLRWCKSRRAPIALFFLSLAILFIVYGLYGLPVGIPGYTALLLTTAAAGFAAVDLVRYTHRYIQLAKLPGRFPLGEMPLAREPVAEEYTAVITALEAERVRLTGELQAQQRDAERYFTLWAHQIKTPIAALGLLLQGENGPERDKAMATQLYSIEQYVGMVLQYQRLSSMQEDLVLETHGLEKLVKRAVKNSAPLFIYKNLKLELGALTGSIVTDEKWFVFVLEQLLSNASKYTHSGSVTICQQGPDTLLIQDTGIGIAPEDLPMVFQRGFTGATGRQDSQATGIGLYLCKQILTRLGFGITIESTKGSGTTVCLQLGQQTLEND